MRLQSHSCGSYAFDLIRLTNSNPLASRAVRFVGTAAAYGAMVMSRPWAVRAQITAMSRAMRTIDHTG